MKRWGHEWAAVAVMAKGVQCEAALLCLASMNGGGFLADPGLQKEFESLIMLRIGRELELAT